MTKTEQKNFAIIAQAFADAFNRAEAADRAYRRVDAETTKAIEAKIGPEPGQDVSDEDVNAYWDAEDDIRSALGWPVLEALSARTEARKAAWAALVAVVEANPLAGGELRAEYAEIDPVRIATIRWPMIREHAARIAGL